MIQDQGGTVHAYDYDKLGRQTQDRVTALGTGVDGAVRRLATSYEVRGMVETITSYDNATVGTGSIVNEVQFAYNDFGQVATDYQAHGGAVNTSTSPKVQYGYANGSANTIRPTTLTYPDGRVLTYDYGSANSMPDALSRVDALVDDDMGTTHLADYEYLGLARFVEQDDTEPDVKWTLIDLAGSNDPDTGDIYSGLDRFGRVKDNRWYDYGSSADVDRIQYGYDRSGNRIWRENPVAAALSKEFDELYTNDLIHRLKTLERGTLDSGHSTLNSMTFAECWSLDPTGNWKKYLEDTNGDGTWDLNQARAANQVNEITDITETAGPSWATPAYGANGNTTTIPQPDDPTTSFTATYDAWNRLVKLVDDDTSNTVQENEYDGRQFRIVRKDYAVGALDKTRHLYYTHAWQCLEQRVDSSTAAERQFVWGLRYLDDLVLRDRDTIGNSTLDERLYAMQDANWNVVTLVSTSGTVQQRFAYDPYGRSLVLSANFTGSTDNHDWETRFTSRELDLTTGLDGFRNRYYHNRFGLFLSRDPLQYVDGMSLYRAYFVMVGVDPSGRGYVYPGPIWYPGVDPGSGSGGMTGPLPALPEPVRNGGGEAPAEDCADCEQDAWNDFKDCENHSNDQYNRDSAACLTGGLACAALCIKAAIGGPWAVAACAASCAAAEAACMFKANERRCRDLRFCHQQRRKDLKRCDPTYDPKKPLPPCRPWYDPRPQPNY